MTNYIRLANGKYCDLSNFTKDDVDIDAILSSLELINRFNGHYTVAVPLDVVQHTMLTTAIATILYPDDKSVHLDCLLHDLGEAYYGDISSPVKRAIGDDYRSFAHSIDFVIYKELWCLPEAPGEHVAEARHICDLVALDIERRSMWNDDEDETPEDAWPYVKQMDEFAPQRKYNMFAAATRLNKYHWYRAYNALKNGNSIATAKKVEIIL